MAQRSTLLMAHGGTLQPVCTKFHTATEKPELSA